MVPHPWHLGCISILAPGILGWILGPMLHWIVFVAGTILMVMVPIVVVILAKRTRLVVKLRPQDGSPADVYVTMLVGGRVLYRRLWSGFTLLESIHERGLGDIGSTAYEKCLKGQLTPHASVRVLGLRLELLFDFTKDELAGIARAWGQMSSLPVKIREK